MNDNRFYRAVTAFVGTAVFGSGLLDASTNMFPYADPATLFLAGSGLVTAALLQRKSDD